MSRYRAPSWEWPAAGMAHLFAFSFVALAQCGSHAEPLFRAEDTITVEMTGPPAAASRMPQKAERAPDAVRGAAEPDAVKPPPNPSELSLPMDKQQKGDPNADARRKDLMDELRKQQLLRDLTADEGKTDRLATGDSQGEGLSAQSGLHDPEAARWIRTAEAALAKNFNPLPAWCAGGRGVSTKAVAPMDATGAITGEAEVSSPSGNPNFDAACVLAFAKTRRLPPPPPSLAGRRPELECVCP